MNARKTIIYVIALLLTAAGIWWLLREKSPEEQIKDQLKTLCELICKKAGEKNTQLALKNHSLVGIFADPTEIDGDAGPVSGLHTPSELASLITRGRASLKTIDLRFTDLSIEVQSPETAAISFTGKLTVEGKQTGSGTGDTYRQVSAKLRKVEKKWLFSSFKVVNVMKGQ